MAEGYSTKDTVTISKNPGQADTIKGKILDARVKDLAANDPSLSDLFSAPNGHWGPDWVNAGTSTATGWYDLTTSSMWARHTVKYAPGFAPGFGILWK